MIDRKKIIRIKKKISKEFPEFMGVEPTVIEKIVKPQDALYKKLSLGVPKQLKRIYRLKFTRIVETVDEIEMERILMVTLNEQGEIIKMTQSR
jgi:hypothetical protein